MKSNKGFSLVELIVVIAIMAIIAGVAIPVYSGYITKANKGSDEAVYNDIVHAAKIVSVENDFRGKEITVTVGSDKITVTSTDSNAAAAEVAKVVTSLTTGDSGYEYDLLSSEVNAKVVTVTLVNGAVKA